MLGGGCPVARARGPKGVVRASWRMPQGLKPWAEGSLRLAAKPAYAGSREVPFQSMIWMWSFGGLNSVGEMWARFRGMLFVLAQWDGEAVLRGCCEC